MPNHVTNKVSAPVLVLKALINESGKIDFNTILPFRGQFAWNGMSEQQQRQWTAWARDLKGWPEDEAGDE